MLLDASDPPRKWTVPPIYFGDVQRVNRSLRLGGSEIELPKDPKTGEVLTDWHHPRVQEWFLVWPGAPVLVGAILLERQAADYTDREFATCWRGDACDRLREAIWKEWVEYLPSQARALAKQIERSITEQRANAAQHLSETFTLLIESGQLALDQTLENARAELERLRSRTTGPNATAGSTVEPSGSIPAPSA